LLAKTGAATREAREVKLQAKPKGGTSRSAGGEEREPLWAWPAASVALPVRAASAAAVLAVTDYEAEAKRAEWAAVLAAAARPVGNSPPDDVLILPVDGPPQELRWKQQAAWGGCAELYPVQTG